MLRRTVPLFAMCALLPLAAISQQPAPDKAPPAPESSGYRITVQANEVILPVTVTDGKGRFVSNLDAKDFQIFHLISPLVLGKGSLDIDTKFCFP